MRYIHYDPLQSNFNALLWAGDAERFGEIDQEQIEDIRILPTPKNPVSSRRRIHFTVSHLQKYYHLPLKTAAERLGICEAALKRICRRNHISKWPYRQLSSVIKRITEVRILLQTQNKNEPALVSPNEITPQKYQTTDYQAFQLQDQLEQLIYERDRIIDSAHFQVHHNYRIGATNITCESNIPNSLINETEFEQYRYYSLNNQSPNCGLILLAQVCMSHGHSE